MIKYITIILMLLCAGCVQNKDTQVIPKPAAWYKHTVNVNTLTVAKWKKLTYSYQLAVCADLTIIVNHKARNYMKKMKSVDVIKPYAKDLMKGINEVVEVSGDEVLINEIIAMIAITAGWEIMTPDERP